MAPIPSPFPVKIGGETARSAVPVNRHRSLGFLSSGFRGVTTVLLVTMFGSQFHGIAPCVPKNNCHAPKKCSSRRGLGQSRILNKYWIFIKVFFFSFGRSSIAPAASLSPLSALAGGTLGFFLFAASIHPAFATTVIPPRFAELVNESSYIVRAAVKSVNAEERTRANGSRLIFSRVELEVKEVIAGRPPSPLVLEILGGRIGDRELTIAGAPKFLAGEESILFVQNNGRQVFPLVRMMYGMYRIKRDPSGRPEYILRSDGSPLHSVSEVSDRMHDHAPLRDAGAMTATALSPDDFIRQIRAAVTKPELSEN